jgi:hypothetical protein
VIEVACSTKKWGSAFFRTLQCEETKGIIHSRIIPAIKVFRKSRDVTIAVSYIISALISCNFIIKNYVSRKITSYIFFLIFTKSLWLHVKHFIALTKRESVRRIFYCNYRSGLRSSTHRPRKTWESTTALTTKNKKACVRITYGQSGKTQNYT